MPAQKASEEAETRQPRRGRAAVLTSLVVVAIVAVVTFFIVRTPGFRAMVEARLQRQTDLVFTVGGSSLVWPGHLKLSEISGLTMDEDAVIQRISLSQVVARLRLTSILSGAEDVVAEAEIDRCTLVFGPNLEPNFSPESLDREGVFDYRSYSKPVALMFAGCDLLAAETIEWRRADGLAVGVASGIRVFRRDLSDAELERSFTHLRVASAVVGPGHRATDVEREWVTTAGTPVLTMSTGQWQRAASSGLTPSGEAIRLQLLEE